MRDNGDDRRGQNHQKLELEIKVIAVAGLWGAIDEGTVKNCG